MNEVISSIDRFATSPAAGHIFARGATGFRNRTAAQIDIRDLGATGGSDDTTVIQNGMDAAASASRAGSTFVVPEGTWRAAGLVVPAGFGLLVLGTLKAPNSFSGNSVVKLLAGCRLSAPGAIDGNRTSVTSQYCVGVLVDGVSGVRLTDVTVQNTRGSGIALTASSGSLSDCVLDGLSVTNVGKSGSGGTEKPRAVVIGLLPGGATCGAIDRVLVRHGLIKDCEYDGLMLRSASGSSAMTRISVSGIHIENTQANGIGFTANDSDATHQRIAFSDITVKSAGQQNASNGGNGLYVNCSTPGRVADVSVRDVWVDGVPVSSDNGIEITGPTRVTIDGVTVRNVLNTAKAGVSVSANSVQIGKVRAEGCAGFAANVYGDAVGLSQCAIDQVEAVTCGGGLRVLGVSIATIGKVVGSGLTAEVLNVGDSLATSGSRVQFAQFAVNQVIANSGTGIVIDGDTANSSVYSTDVTIAHADVTGSTSHGIKVSDCKRVSLGLVRVYLNAKYGMYFQNCQEVSIGAGSQILDNGTGGVNVFGVRLETVVGFHANGSRFGDTRSGGSKTQTHGVSVSAGLPCSSVYLTGNQMSGNATAGLTGTPSTPYQYIGNIGLTDASG